MNIEDQRNEYLFFYKIEFEATKYFEEQRKAFERNMFTETFMFSTIWQDGEYIDLYTQSMWESWLASANRQGYKLPLELEN